MSATALQLESDPATALAAIREASRRHPVVVFKHSPICPTSDRAKKEFLAWLDSLGEDADLSYAHVDVIRERPLARGLTAELGVRHESPQALWFRSGELAWHGSHGTLDRACFEGLLAGA